MNNRKIDKQSEFFFLSVLMFVVGFFVSDLNFVAPIHELGHFLVGNLFGLEARIISWTSTDSAAINLPFLFAGFLAELLVYGIGIRVSYTKYRSIALPFWVGAMGGMGKYIHSTNDLQSKLSSLIGTREATALRNLFFVVYLAAFILCLLACIVKVVTDLYLSENKAVKVYTPEKQQKKKLRKQRKRLTYSQLTILYKRYKYRQSLLEIPPLAFSQWLNIFFPQEYKRLKEHEGIVNGV
ncbi:MAG: hypothetical protein ACLFR1_15435 [Spirochaetia bacterium]